MSNKMAFGFLITIVGLVFSTLSYIYAAMNPWDYNGIEGILGSLLGTHMLIPFIIGVAILILGISICFKEAYLNDK